LMAEIPSLDRGSAQRLTQQRLQLKKGFDQLTDAKPWLPQGTTLEAKHLSTQSNHFEITGELRYEDSVLRELSLVQRRGTEVRVLRRDRLSS
jgi:type II secretory pathway component PulK